MVAKEPIELDLALTREEARELFLFLTEQLEGLQTTPLKLVDVWNELSAYNEIHPLVD